MKEKLKKIMQISKLWKVSTLIVIVVLILIIITTGVFAGPTINNENSINTNSNNSISVDTSSKEDLSVAIVGEDSSITGNIAPGNSWPGEIISLNNLQIQPDREGTISQWYVHIGERVYKGQVLGRLSRPPQTPEMINMLGEKSQMLSEARTNTEALRAYTAKRILQLQQLRTGDTVLSVIESKKKLAQVILRNSLSKVYPFITGRTIVPTSGVNSYFQFKENFGIKDIDSRIDFVNNFYKMLADLKDKNIVPEKTGLLYFDLAIKLANSTYVDSETITEESLESLKNMLSEDQTEFITILGEIKNMEIENSAMIAELEKELAMSEGEVKAKEIAYETISNSITNGYSIIAPNSGVVSSIMKKPGEFVEPGVPIATVNAGNNESVLVRIRIPNNIKKPKIGEILSVVRPGFGTDMQKVRLIGIGSSLDTDGSYMADAAFIDEIKWPVGVSVRVFESVNSSAVLIKYAAVIFDGTGNPSVWAISEADRIFSKKITIGRTLGDLIEVYTGLVSGERYIVNPPADIKEDTLLNNLIKNSSSKENNASTPAKSGGHENMPGM